MSWVLAIDIGGTKIAGALVNEEAHVLAAENASLPTPKTGGEDVAAAVAQMASQLQSQAQEHGLQPRAVGIGSAGVVDPEGRRIVSATDAIPGWGGTELAKIVETQVKLPVTIENDVHAHARGEMWMGAGRGLESAIMVAVGTGIGGAIISGGQILRGSHGLAGHLGHLPASMGQDRPCSCGVLGHIEAIGSGPGMSAWYNHRATNGSGSESRLAARFTPVANARELEQRAQAGDELAGTVMSEAAYATGQILAGLVNSFDPQTVIVGGGLANAGPHYWDGLRAGYHGQLMPPLAQVPLVAAELGTQAALLGAAALAFTQI
ncbi:MAG: ROK family protein [Actinomycetaceae bacterium]|nr:ROK family protein [Actinomycetaceae bacterium]